MSSSRGTRTKSQVEREFGDQKSHRLVAELTSSLNNHRAPALVCFLILVLSLAQHSESLRFSSIQIPALVQRGSNFVLACSYELEPSEQLYSVKWYKGNEEFYKLQLSSPAGNPPLAVDPQPIDPQHQNQNQLHTQRAGQAGQDAPLPGIVESGQQQQYFSQAGVNVRMSLSNATHVHMLNASLESEGAYACEISTQMLSTIRYEKEIRVYVLPQTRLNVAGFKQRYALGDRVELICASDFTRPRPALAWFANGRRISKSSKMFELEPSLQAKPIEGQQQQLTRVTLALRFKLTGELLVAHSIDSEQSSVARNSSVTTSPGSWLQADQTLKLQCKFRLAEVSDVAFNELTLSATSNNKNGASATTVNNSRDDKTINSGKSRQDYERRRRRIQASEQGASSSDLIDARKPVTDTQAKPENPVGSGAVGRGNQQIRRKRRSGSRGREKAAPTAPITVFKSSQENQVVQSKAAATNSELELRHYFEAVGSNSGSDCATGALALQPDDPILVLRKNSSNLNNEKQSSGSSGLLQANLGDYNNNNQLWFEAGPWPNERPRKRQLDLNLNGAEIVTSNDGDGDGGHGRDEELRVGNQAGDELNVDCMTIGAILGGASGRSGATAMPLLSSVDPNRSEAGDTSTGDQNEDRNETDTGSNTIGDNSDMIKLDQRLQQHVVLPMQFCNDEQARRQWAISGKSSYNEPFMSTTNTRFASDSQAAWLGPANQRVAYVNISASASKTNRVLLKSTKRRRRQFADVVQVQQQSSQYKQFQQDQRMGPATSRQLLAPPLLEWFINNHEAPDSSVNYEPELPMLASATSRAKNASVAQFSNTPRSDLQASSEETLEIQPINYNIDYAEYFANFDSKPIEQRLSLRLNLKKEHFLTPDSKLTLRCSSTQAQILMVDSVDLNIVSVNSKISLANHLQSTTNSWQKRRVPNQDHYQQTLATNNNNNNHNRVNQAKLLHQHQQQHGKSRADGRYSPSIMELSFFLALISVLLA